MADSDIVRLTQGQIKMIGDKIKEAGGGGGITELTSADYNYPASNPDRLNLLGLDVGTYLVNPQGESIAVGSALVSANYYYPFIAIVAYDRRTASSGPSKFAYMFNGNDVGAIPTILKSNGRFVSIVNNLTSTNDFCALSANQGKVLNDKIGGDLSNLTTTDKASLIAAINELVTRVAALEGN